MPDISVIIPNYNCEKWISKTLDSCLEQKEFLKEIIVVDDYSTDNSWDILSKYQLEYPGLIKIYKNKMKGGNNARNYGFELSAGEYIQWLDADDQIVDNKFAAQLAIFKNSGSVDIVYSDWKLITYNSSGEVMKEEQKKNRRYHDYLYELLINNWSAPHTYLLKRGIAQKLFSLQAWNPATAVGQDREYFTIAALEGARFEYAPGFFAIYNRWNKSSVSSAKTGTRYINLEKMLNRFEDLLHAQSNITPNQIVRYQQIINTQKLLIKVAGFDTCIRYGKVQLHNIEWKIVKGIRTNIKMIWEIIKLKRLYASLLQACF